MKKDDIRKSVNIFENFVSKQVVEEAESSFSWDEPSDDAKEIQAAKKMSRMYRSKWNEIKTNLYDNIKLTSRLSTHVRHEEEIAYDMKGDLEYMKGQLQDIIDGL